MNINASGQRSYMPQLDALRFFAVLGVLVGHYWHPRRLPWLLGDLDWAGLGVRLFFVLSGFLITGILLECRDAAGSSTGGRLFSMRQFYIRRFLRIFPVYYLVVGLVILLNIPPAREVWAWLLTYTSNIYITFNGNWMGRLGHFWSLAVEEQFYLVWPWLILFAPRKWLVPAMLAAIAMSPVYRLYAYYAFPFDIGAKDFMAGTLTPANLDSLGIGALLALFWNSDLPRERLQKTITCVVLPVGVLVFLACLVLYYYRIYPAAFFVIGDLGASLVFAWLISAAGMGFRGLPGRFLEIPFLVYLGRISYGIYIYHNFTPLVVIPFFERIGMPLVVPSFRVFVASSIVTIAVSMLSWHLFELPINNLKRHFSYRPKRPAGAAEQGQLAEGRAQS